MAKRYDKNPTNTDKTLQLEHSKRICLNNWSQIERRLRQLLRHLPHNSKKSQQLSQFKQELRQPLRQTTQEAIAHTIRGPAPRRKQVPKAVWNGQVYLTPKRSSPYVGNGQYSAAVSSSSLSQFARRASIAGIISSLILSASTS